MDPSQEVPEEDLKRIVQVIEDRFGRPHLPSAGESVGVTTSIPKTAALFFDRVWSPPDYFAEGPPPDIAAYGATAMEMWSLATYHLAKDGDLPDQVLARIVRDISSTDVGQILIREGPVARDLSDALLEERGIHATPLFDSEDALQREYHPGSYEVVIAAVQDVNVVDEMQLTWEQVRQLRSDKEARRNYRRFLQWLDASIGKSGTAIADEIAERLHQYDSALKKHGINTMLGALDVVIDPKLAAGASVLIASLSLAGATTTVAGWSAVAMYIGRAACAVARGFFDIRTTRATQNREIAFLNDIRRS